MDDKDKINLIKDLMTNPVYDAGQSSGVTDSDMRELVRAIIVHNGTAEEFFKVNFNVDLDKMRDEKKLTEAEKKVFMKED